MTKISKVKRCLRLPPNRAGRDLVVGDLHGHRALFEAELHRIGFDPRRDRVLSVGDLIDRGPDSLDTLALIEEPWFHAVLGNHELMLLNYLGYYTSGRHSIKSYSAGGGSWIHEALSRQRKALMRLADRATALPLAIHVDGSVPFNVMHGDLHPLGARQDCLIGGNTICVHKADASTSSRANISAAPQSELLGLRFGKHEVEVSPTPLSTLPITYVGHSPRQRVTIHNSYVYIDQGVCISGASRYAAPTPPTLLDHREFAYWLEGVTSACAA